MLAWDARAALQLLEKVSCEKSACRMNMFKVVASLTRAKRLVGVLVATAITKLTQRASRWICMIRFAFGICVQGGACRQASLTFNARNLANKMNWHLIT